MIERAAKLVAANLGAVVLKTGKVKVYQSVLIGAALAALIN